MTVKALSFKRMELKEVTEEGTFEGILSPYGNVDQGDDVVEPGAYTKTLREKGVTRPLLWQHKSDTPIGELTLEDRPEGLFCKGKLLLQLAKAKEAHVLLKAGVVKGLSIGFQTVKDEVKDGVRRLKEIKLYEGSIVTFPMNEEALISAVKRYQIRNKADAESTPPDFNEELAEVLLWSCPYDMMTALQGAISEMYRSGLSKEEMLGGFGTIFTQFSEAYLGMLPGYLDALAERYASNEYWSARQLEAKASVAALHIEIKAGARFSASTKQALTAACEKVLGGHSEIMALINDDAGADKAATSSAKAAVQSEPLDLGHSASKIDEILKLLSNN